MHKIYIFIITLIVEWIWNLNDPVQSCLKMQKYKTMTNTKQHITLTCKCEKRMYEVKIDHFPIKLRKPVIYTTLQLVIYFVNPWLPYSLPPWISTTTFCLLLGEDKTWCAAALFLLLLLIEENENDIVVFKICV